MLGRTDLTAYGSVFSLGNLLTCLLFGALPLHDKHGNMMSTYDEHGNMMSTYDVHGNMMSTYDVHGNKLDMIVEGTTQDFQNLHRVGNVPQSYLRGPDFPDLSPPLRDLIEKMLTNDDYLRPSVKGALRHPWFTGEHQLSRQMAAPRHNQIVKAGEMHILADVIGDSKCIDEELLLNEYPLDSQTFQSRQIMSCPLDC